MCTACVVTRASLCVRVPRVLKEAAELQRAVALVRVRVLTGMWCCAYEDLLDVDRRVHDIWVVSFFFLEPPKSSSILRKSSDKRKPIRCVKFTEAIARHTKIRDQKSFARMYLPR